MHRHVKGCKIDGVAVYFAYVEVLLYFDDMGGGDVVGGSPDFGWGGRVLVVFCELRGWGRGSVVARAAQDEGRGKRTWSVRDSQCARGMSVTTRPGASGVPRWS